MAQRTDDLLIAHLDGAPVLEVVDDTTSHLLWGTQYQSADVTVTSPSVVLRRDDSNSKTLTTVTASSGVVDATVTSADLDDAGAQIGDDLLAELTGTYTSGGDTFTIRHRSAVTVVSRWTRSAVLYTELTDRYHQLSKSCALPSGQSTFHPQIRAGLRDFRREMHIRFSRLPDTVYPDQLAALQVAYCMASVVHSVRGQQNGVSRYWDDELAYWRGPMDDPGNMGEIGRLWDLLTIVVEANRQDWTKMPDTHVQMIEGRAHRQRRPDGPVSHGGGM